MKLKGETAIITGSTSGIGRNTASLILGEGCKVTICSRSKEKVEKTVSELKKEFGDNVYGSVCDVSRFEDIEKIVDETVSRFGSVRILIANAGMLPVYGPFKYLSGEQIKKYAKSVFETNLIGTVNSIGAVLPQMLKQKYGRIITLSGGGGTSPVANLSLYGASKGGVSSFSKCLSRELKAEESDIKLNIFQPGPMKTEMNETLNLVDGWVDKDEFLENWNKLYDNLNLDIDDCSKRIIPYISPKCRVTGKTFLGFSVMKMIPKFPMIMSAMKIKN